MDEQDQEYLEPGDLLEFLTDIDLLCFDIPTAGRTEYKCLISAFKGDLVRYLGVRFRAKTHGIMQPIPVHEFMLIRLDDNGNVQEEHRFFSPNVETLLKWTERLE